ncbi:MAG TPA: maleylpyruvate isomerase family mycothiol-dependent enzyme [Streptosporangiaceae bacterium]|nr:maleylpyruvate isomerase family mycothiol-dependent enzyme [Streptosporangiaceae bacterium]
METAPMLQTVPDDARSLLAAAASDWDRPVPHCPEWDAADLVGHMGSILMWMAAVVRSRERISRRRLDPPPQDPAELPGWYLHTLEDSLRVLGAADPNSQTWTFSSTGDRRVAWWQRRLAVEVAVHRWDAQHAVAADGGPSPKPLDGELAASGTAEFMIEFLPGLLADDSVNGLDGTLHLHATDGPTEWWIDLSAAGAIGAANAGGAANAADGNGADGPAGAALPRHAKADTAVRGTRSDLLLWLTNRGPLDSLEVFGRPEIFEGWKQLQR